MTWADGSIVITTTINDGFGVNIDRVEVLIPRTNEENGQLFARMKVSEP